MLTLLFKPIAPQKNAAEAAASICASLNAPTFPHHHHHPQFDSHKIAAIANMSSTYSRFFGFTVSGCDTEPFARESVQSSKRLRLEASDGTATAIAAASVDDSDAHKDADEGTLAEQSSWYICKVFEKHLRKRIESAAWLRDAKGNIMVEVEATCDELLSEDEAAFEQHDELFTIYLRGTMTRHEHESGDGDDNSPRRGKIETKELKLLERVRDEILGLPRRDHAIKWTTVNTCETCVDHNGFM